MLGNLLTRRATLVALGALALGELFVHVLAAHLAARFHGTPPSAVGNSLFDSITDPHLLPRTLTRTGEFFEGSRAQSLSR